VKTKKATLCRKKHRGRGLKNAQVSGKRIIWPKVPRGGNVTPNSRVRGKTVRINERDRPQRGRIESTKREIEELKALRGRVGSQLGPQGGGQAFSEKGGQGIYKQEGTWDLAENVQGVLSRVSFALRREDREKSNQPAIGKKKGRYEFPGLKRYKNGLST